MSTNVGSIHYDVDLDTKKFDSASKSISGKAKKIGTSMTSMGKKMTLGLSLPIAIGAGLAIKKASDLSETLNKVDVAFGKNAQEARPGQMQEYTRKSSLSFRRPLYVGCCRMPQASHQQATLDSQCHGSGIGMRRGGFS